MNLVSSDTDFTTWITIGSFIGGTLLVGATAAWAASQWFAAQFSATRNLIDIKIEKLEANILAKLEYHEKHDDQRFDSQDQRLDHLRNDLWEIRVRNAALDAERLKGK